MPVSVLNITLKRCCDEPTPPEPKLSLPGFALAIATSSLGELAGEFAGTTRKLGTMYARATYSKSLIGSKPSFE